MEKVDPASVRRLLAAMVETVPVDQALPESKKIIQEREGESLGRFGEDEGFRTEEGEAPADKDAGGKSGGPRVRMDGSTDQGFRKSPGVKPPRRDPLNQTDTREWRRDYQDDYRRENPQ